MDTEKGRYTQDVKPGAVVWLQANTQVLAIRADGTSQSATITADGELRLPKKPIRPRVR